MEDITVGPGEVNEFEDALVRLSRRKRFKGLNAIPIDEDDLSRVDFSNKFGTNEVEGAGFRGNDRRILQFPQDEGSESKRVPRGYHLLLGKEEQGIGSFHLLKCLNRPFCESLFLGTGDEVDNHFGIHI